MWTERHAEADTTPVIIERSDALDAAAALAQMADGERRLSKARHYSGPDYKTQRAWLRDTAKIYDAASRRVQRACDEAM